MPGGRVRWYIAGVGGDSGRIGTEVASFRTVLDELGFAAKVRFFFGKGALLSTVFEGEFSFGVSTDTT